MNNSKLEINSILVNINQDNCAIKYCVYRTALKLSQLQDVFQLSQITSSILFNTMENYLPDCDNVLNSISNEAVSFNQLKRIITSMLQACGDAKSSQLHRLVQHLSTLIFETFHDVVEKKVALIAVVLFFIVLNSEDLKLKYMQLFDLYATPLGMLTRSRTGLLLTHLIRLTDVVGESSSFSKINSSVTSCFNGVLGNMISQQQFLQWMLREPQSVVWLPTMHRLILSKTSVHDVECATCKVRPIIGLRFQCLKCIDYNTCQVCFLTQQNSSRSHKLHHPRQEYCLPAGSKEKLNAFARTVRNIVTKRYKHKTPSLSYLPISEDKASLIQVPVDLKSDKGVKEENTNFGDLSHLADEERKKLEKIVKKLKTENKKISGTVHLLETSTNENENVENDNALLQSHLDTVTLQNQSLQAELDNLKCVVFAENFMYPGPAFANHTEDSGELNVSEHISTAQKVKKQKHKKKPLEEKLLNTNTISKTEKDLHDFLGKLQDSLLKNVENSSTQPPLFDKVCQAAGEVRLKLNELIDQTAAFNVDNYNEVCLF